MWLILLNVMHWIGITALIGILFVIAFVVPNVAKKMKVPVGRLRMIVLQQAKRYLFGAAVLVGVTGVGLVAVHWNKMSIPLYAGLVVGKVVVTILLVANLWLIVRQVRQPKQGAQRTNLVEFSRMRNRKWFTRLAMFNLAGIAMLLMAAAFLRQI